MQPQINAIKQLLEANNAIASQIDRTIVDWLGDSASWENASTYQSISAFDSGHGSLPDYLYDSSPKNFQTLELLWRSRVDLNDARINAEEVDLEAFLACLLEEQKQSKVSLSSYLKSDEVIAERDCEIERLKAELEFTRFQVRNRDNTSDKLRDIIEHNKNAFAKELRVASDLIAERDREIDGLRNSETSRLLENHNRFLYSVMGVLGFSEGTVVSDSDILGAIAKLKSDSVERDHEIERLKLRIGELEWTNEPSDRAPISPNLEALENAVDKAINPRLLQKIAERDRQIKQLEEQNEAIAKQLVVAERRVVYLTESNSADLAHIKKANSALEFLRRVHDEGGAIVPSRFCSSLEIILAKNDGRFFADKHAEYDEDAICEYVLRTEKLRTLSDLSLQRVRDLSLIQGVTPEEYLSLEIPESDRYVEINGVKINTELAFRDLIKLRDREIENLKLALDAAKKPTDDLQMECDQLRRDLRDRDRVITHTETEIDSLRLDVREKSQDISLLKTTIKGFEAALDLANEKASKAIAPNLDAFQSAVDEAVNSALLEKIAERDRQLEEVTNHHSEFVQSLKDALKGYRLTEESEILTTIAHITTDYIAMVDELKEANESDRQIQELQITNKNNREQFDNLKAHFEVLLKAIAMNLNALKGERKPDEIREVNGVMTTFRNYDDNLTHHHKTIIIENLQRAIAEEAKKLKGVNPKDFSFDDDIPF